MPSPPEPPRLLTLADIPAAMVLKDSASWNQTVEDWENVIRLAPRGCFAIQCDGKLVATATAVIYQKRLAWIGMVLTHPDYRGRGYARSLMEQSLAHLDAEGVDWIKLDATDMGRPLYLQLGFEDEAPIERWLRPAGDLPFPSRDRREAVPFDPALDFEAFGADRRELLAVLSRIESASVPGKGLAMGRPGSNATYFGPCVCRDQATARELARSFVARHSHENIYWDLLPANASAVELAREFGFEPRRRLTRMVRRGVAGGADLLHNDSLVFAVAGFEYG